MEPLNDHELNDLLRQWQAPMPPANLDARVLPGESRQNWGQWLLRGSIRVPVPAGILTLVILALLVYWAVSARQRVENPPHSVTLTDFQPVKELKPRIIRSGYEGK